jgi:peptidoglycan/LPS O-acetylase OafA/YrhL
MKPMKLGPAVIVAPPAAGPALPRESDRIAGFDGLRALAFLCVFANHKLEIAQRDALGSVGVWTFFVLSGFLITSILARSRQDVEAGRMSRSSALRRFYFRRTARIFPVYYVLLACMLVVSLFTYVDNFWLRYRVAYFLYATNIAIDMRGAWLGEFGHLWSLAVEEQYYLLFAPLVLLLPRRRTALACLAMVGAGLATALILHALNAHPIAVYVNSLVNFGMLGFGGLVGLAARTRAPAWLTGSLAQGGVTACLIAAPIAFGAHHDQWLAYGPGIVLLAGLLLFQIYNGQQTRFVALLETAPLRLIGRVSYAAYLFHPFINFSALQRLAGAAGQRLDASRPLQILIEFAVTMVLCTISWHLLEAPIVRWAGRVSQRLFRAPAGRILEKDAAQVA